MVTFVPAFSQIPFVSSYHSLLTTSAAGNTYTSGSSPQPLSKNELDHYHLLRRNTLQKITMGQVFGIWRQSIDFVFSLPISRWLIGCTRNPPSSDSYWYEYEPKGKHLYLHGANLTIFTLLHPIHSAAIFLSLHGNVFTKPVVSAWNAQLLQLVRTGVYYTAMVP